MVIMRKLGTFSLKTCNLTYDPDLVEIQDLQTAVITIN
jgi:hypothetical protein